MKNLKFTIFCFVFLFVTNILKSQNIATSIGAVSGCIGDTVTVPVTINMASGISTAAISMAIGYDPTKLQCISSVTSLNSNISAGFLSNC
ncbi:MAG: Cohesin domain, partial [Bacteroidota bacterium]